MSYHIERSSRRVKTGSVEDGTAAAHILSLEVANAVMRHTTNYYSEEDLKRISYVLNEGINLRIKSVDGNLTGSDGYSGDRYYDGQIIQAIDSDDKILTNQKSAERLRRAWQVTQMLDLPSKFKADIREQFTKLRDPYNQVIVWYNESLY